MDKRLGYRNDRGRIIKYPDNYADGAPFSRVTNPAPTMYWLNHNYFVVMAINAAGISEEGLAMFNDFADQAEQARLEKLGLTSAAKAANLLQKVSELPVTKSKAGVSTPVEVVTPEPEVEPAPAEQKDTSLPDDATALRILGTADAGLDATGKPVKKTPSKRTKKVLE